MLLMFPCVISLDVVEATGPSVPAWIPTAALAAGFFALAGIAMNRYCDRRDQRRTLYAEAYRAALAWVEMLYRVRRRDPSDPYPLAAQFHTLQEGIDFHQGWIDSESLWLGRAYRRLVRSIKALTFGEIKNAWKNAPCSPDDGFSLAEETHPPVAAAKEQFIGDLRDHLSLHPLNRRRLRQRYSDDNWQRVLASAPTVNHTGGAS
jgi:hypothetical protein